MTINIPWTYNNSSFTIDRAADKVLLLLGTNGGFLSIEHKRVARKRRVR